MQFSVLDNTGNTIIPAGSNGAYLDQNFNPVSFTMSIGAASPTLAFSTETQNGFSLRYQPAQSPDAQLSAGLTDSVQIQPVSGAYAGSAGSGTFNVLPLSITEYQPQVSQFEYITYNPVDGNLWLIDNGLGFPGVATISPTNPTGPAQNCAFMANAYPSQIAVDPSSGTVWVPDYASGRVWDAKPNCTSTSTFTIPGASQLRSGHRRASQRFCRPAITAMLITPAY